MTGSTRVAVASETWTLLPARVLPFLGAALLLSGSASGASLPGGQPGSLAARVAAGGASAPDTEAPVSPPSYALAGRSRVEMRFGASNLDVSHDDWIDALDVTGGDFSLAFVHWAHENLALEVTLGATNIGVSSRRTFRGDVVRAEALYRLMAGGRLYLPVRGAFRPHVDLAGGLLTEVHVRDNPGHTEVTGRSAKAGLEVGGGGDFLFGNHFVVGVRAAALVRDGYRSQLNAGCSLGWTFGGRRQGER